MWIPGIDNQNDLAPVTPGGVLTFCHVFVGKFPIDGLPPGFQVVRARIAVIDVIGMLPDVASQDRNSNTIAKRVGGIVSLLRGLQKENS